MQYRYQTGFFRSLFSPAEIAAPALCSSRAPRSLQPQAARGAKHGNNQEGLVTAGLNRLRKNRQDCHPEEPQATKDLCICLILQMQRFFASLRMTAPTSSSAACKAPPFQFRGEKSVVVLPYR